MIWNNLTEELQLEEIKQLSEHKPVLIFKHSTRCSISSTAKDKLERNWKAEHDDKIQPYYLDLIKFRSISNKIAADFGVEHQSPQALLIKGGKSIFTASHMAININELVKNI